MDNQRPDPDALLKALQPHEPRQRGRLKIFFGACAGVGKTYAMLSAAQEKHDDGVRVVAGLVETHGRVETEELLTGLTLLPRLQSTHRGVTMTEFDLDAALATKPELILVDELAHTNAPGSRHPKRWMDIEELLAAGIDVYTTLNVQHVESLNDVVAGITGIRVRETVPDAVFDKADDIALVDIPSDDLLTRLHEGKVYITDMGRKRAAENFFKRENLIALRELALRRTAERLEAQSNEGRSLNPQRRVASERLAVCIGPGELTPRLLRATKRMADGLRASWVAVYVENARHYRLDYAGQLQLEHHFKLAADMGGKTELLQGENAADAILDFARRNGITKIIAGKPPKSVIRELLQSSLASDLIRGSESIDIHVVTGQDALAMPAKDEPKQRIAWRGYVLAVVMTAIATSVGLPFRGAFNAENVMMLYLLSIIILAARYGLGVSLLASVLSFLSYNMFFTLPYYSLTVASYNDVLTLLLLLVTGFFAGLQTSKLRAQSQFFLRKERTTAALYAMSQALADTRERGALMEVITRHIEQSVDGTALIWFPGLHGDLEPATRTTMQAGVKEEVVIRWVYSTNQPAGLGTSTMPSARGYFMPLRGSSGVLGVLGMMPRLPERLLTPEEKDLLETFVSLAASALDRVSLSAVAEAHGVEAESERLRNALLSSVSHDLRTPLASIKGVISSLLLEDDRLSHATKQQLLSGARDEVARLERIVGNLLDVTRLESGQVMLRRDYYYAPELVGNAMKQVGSALDSHTVHIALTDAVPALWVDGLLTEQVLVNLLENAAKYTPPHSHITIHAQSVTDSWVEFVVEDDGPGIPVARTELVFEKFATFSADAQTHGTGLGLTICRGVIHAHGGEIAVRNRETGGARFTFTLPAAPPPPADMADV